MAFKRYLLGVFTVTFLSFTGYIYYFRKKKEDEHIVSEVLMFSEGDSHLRKSKYSRCMITSSMNKTLEYLNSCKQSLDICMYVITNQDLTNIILKQNFKGVKVRIIIDSVMAYSTGSSIRRIQKQGIEVRWLKSTNIMHHKFCLIDAFENGTVQEIDKRRPLVMTGSLNWTNQALFGNFENLLVTSHSEIVEQYRNEFERLWEMFKPIA